MLKPMGGASHSVRTGAGGVLMHGEERGRQRRGRRVADLDTAGLGEARHAEALGVGAAEVSSGIGLGDHADLGRKVVEAFGIHRSAGHVNGELLDHGYAELEEGRAHLALAKGEERVDVARVLRVGLLGSSGLALGSYSDSQRADPPRPSVVMPPAARTAPSRRSRRARTPASWPRSLGGRDRATHGLCVLRRVDEVVGAVVHRVDDALECRRAVEGAAQGVDHADDADVVVPVAAPVRQHRAVDAGGAAHDLVEVDRGGS